VELEGFNVVLREQVTVTDQGPEHPVPSTPIDRNEHAVRILDPLDENHLNNTIIKRRSTRKPEQTRRLPFFA